jgi:hypothetical protein
MSPFFLWHLPMAVSANVMTRPSQEQTAGKMREPLAYVAKVQAQWEKRVLKSLNSMCVELGQTLAKPRCQVQKRSQDIVRDHRRKDRQSSS